MHILFINIKVTLDLKMCFAYCYLTGMFDLHCVE